jgi:hypothetical protein
MDRATEEDCDIEWSIVAKMSTGDDLFQCTACVLMYQLDG